MATGTERKRTAAQPAESSKAQSSGTSEKVRSYPAPKELATPTDLKPEEVRSVVEALNPLIADAFALYTKTKNFHWHVAGSHYRDYHLLLDEQAASIFASIDPLAERARRLRPASRTATRRPATCCRTFWTRPSGASGFSMK